MTITVTLLLSVPGTPDPAWTLTPEQERMFLDRLRAAPVPTVVVGPPSRRPGYAGIMARDGDGTRWVAHRGWIRGGVLTHVDDGRVLEHWLLETGRGTVAPGILDPLLRETAPSR